jgi:cell division protein FtsB
LSNKWGEAQRAAMLEEENRLKADRTRELRDRQDRFHNDPAYVERVARETLGKVRPDEVIFRFTDPETNSLRIP